MQPIAESPQLQQERVDCWHQSLLPARVEQADGPDDPKAARSRLEAASPLVHQEDARSRCKGQCHCLGFAAMQSAGLCCDYQSLFYPSDS